MKRTLLAWVFLVTAASGQSIRPEIPRVWNDREVAAFLIPLVEAKRSPRYMSSSEYYALKVRPAYKSYPVYAPGREPAGYFEALLRKEPEVVFDASALRTEQDWIRAGALIFGAPTDPTPLPAVAQVPAQGSGGPLDGFSKQVVDTMLREVPGPVTREGIVPYLSYTVRKKGLVELDLFTSCASCHTRVLPDGTVVRGAQGNAPAEQQLAWLNKWVLRRNSKFASDLLNLEWTLAGAPWVMSRADFDKALPIDEFMRRIAAMPPGVFERHGTVSSHPSKIPSLIGIKDIAFLDSTGLMRHRSTGDFMRYVASNYGLDIVAHYGDFQPSPVQSGFAEDGTRFSDEQLYALAVYIESLQPPPNPNRFDDAAQKGQRVFEQQGCTRCHVPPLYTNNKLTPAVGATVSDALRRSGDVLNISVGTDPTLALKTRRGTGFYKVPSLRGVWYRNAFGHNGQAETLEEWLDEARLRDDYVPHGFHLGPGAIKGHEFGLKLAPEDKRALIAFLKTL